MAAIAGRAWLLPSQHSNLKCSRNRLGFHKNGRTNTTLVRSNLLLEIAAANPQKKMYAGAAAVVVPLLMAAAAFGAGLLLRRNIERDAISDVEEIKKLVEEGMDLEVAYKFVFDKVEKEFNESPNLKIRRKFRQVVDEPATTLEKKQQPTLEEN